MQQHPAFNTQHAQMLLARGMMGAMPGQRPPTGLYRSPTNGHYHGALQSLDHGPLPPGMPLRGVRGVPPGGPGSVIRHHGLHHHHHQHQQQQHHHHHHHQQPHQQHAQHSATAATYQPPSHLNGLAGTASQGRPPGGPPSGAQPPSVSGRGPNQDSLHRIHHMAAQAATLPESAQTRVDNASAKGIFGWTQVDGVDIPFLLRDEKKYLAVRMVEMKLLSKYPSTYPDELKSRPPLMSHYITDNEAKILNEINKHHCAGEYGQHLFVTQDLIVKMTDFEDFYNIVKKHFPPSILAQLPATLSSEKKVDGGWLQMNNTVVPYVFRSKARYVPLSVIRYAAGLLTDVRVEGDNPKEVECNYLNECCKTAGVEFNFVRTTKLVMLDVVQRLCGNSVNVTELPKEDPFSQAEYHGTLDNDRTDENASSGGSMSLSTNQMPYPGLSAGAAGRGAVNGPSPPSAATGTPVSQSSNVPYWMNQHLGIYPVPPGGFPPGGAHNMRGPARPTLPPGMAHGHPAAVQAAAVQAAAAQAAALSNHIPNTSRPSSQSAHISPPASQYQPKSTEVNNNSSLSGGGAQRRSSHEAMDLSRELASPREKKEHSNPPTPSGTPLGHSLSSSSLPQSTTPIPRTSSAGSSGGGGMHRSTPEGSPQMQLQSGPPGLLPPGIPTLHPSLHVGPDGHPVLGSLVPPGHPGWHPIMNNPVEYNKMVQIMQLQAMAQQQQQQQHQLQQQLQMLEQQHLQQQRLKHHEALTKRPGSRQESTSRSAATALAQVQVRSVPSSSQSQPSPKSQQQGGTRGYAATTMQGSVNKSSLNQAVIQRVEFQGKTLSCIVKGERKEYYALVEALSRVYFPNCTLEDFQFALEKSLQIPLVKLTEEEERSFISFYNIPTKTLMCNRVIRLAEFQELIPQLKAMFRDKSTLAGEKSSDVQARGTVLVSAQSSSKDGKLNLSSSEVRESPTSSSPDTPTVNSDALGKISAALKAYMGKRPAPSDNDCTDGIDSPGPVVKQPKVSIEDAVNRLKQFQAEQKGRRKSSRPERRIGSQSPTSDTPTEYQARSPETDMQGGVATVGEMSVSETTAATQKNTAMDVDVDAIPASEPDQTSHSHSQQSNDNLTAGIKETSVSDSSAQITEDVSAEVEDDDDDNPLVIDFSKQADDVLANVAGAKMSEIGAQNLCMEKNKSGETSTQEWVNNLPKTVPEDLLFNQIEMQGSGAAPVDTTTDVLGINYTAINEQAICVNDAEMHVLDLAMVDSGCETSTDTERVSHTQPKDTAVIAVISQDGVTQDLSIAKVNASASISTASVNAEEEERRNSVSAQPIMESLPNPMLESIDPELNAQVGPSEVIDQPIDLHSTLVAHNSMECGAVINNVGIINVTSPPQKQSTEGEHVVDLVLQHKPDCGTVNKDVDSKTVSAESRLEIAEVQSASTASSAHSSTQVSREGDPVSVQDFYKGKELLRLPSHAEQENIREILGEPPEIDVSSSVSNHSVITEIQPSRVPVLSPSGSNDAQDAVVADSSLVTSDHVVREQLSSMETKSLMPTEPTPTFGMLNQSENTIVGISLGNQNTDTHTIVATTAIEEIKENKPTVGGLILSVEDDVTMADPLMCLVSDSRSLSEDQLLHQSHDTEIIARPKEFSTICTVLQTHAMEHEHATQQSIDSVEGTTLGLSDVISDAVNKTDSSQSSEHTDKMHINNSSNVADDVCVSPQSEPLLVNIENPNQDMCTSRVETVYSPKESSIQLVLNNEVIYQMPRKASPVMGLFPGLGEDEDDEDDLDTSAEERLLADPSSASDIDNNTMDTDDDQASDQPDTVGDTLTLNISNVFSIAQSEIHYTPLDISAGNSNGNKDDCAASDHIITKQDTSDHELEVGNADMMEPENAIISESQPIVVSTSDSHSGLILSEINKPHIHIETDPIDNNKLESAITGSTEVEITCVDNAITVVEETTTIVGTTTSSIDNTIASTDNACTSTDHTSASIGNTNSDCNLEMEIIGANVVSGSNTEPKFESNTEPQTSRFDEPKILVANADDSYPETHMQLEVLNGDHTSTKDVPSVENEQPTSNKESEVSTITDGQEVTGMDTHEDLCNTDVTDTHKPTIAVDTFVNINVNKAITEEITGTETTYNITTVPAESGENTAVDYITKVSNATSCTETISMDPISVTNTIEQVTYPKTNAGKTGNARVTITGDDCEKVPNASILTTGSSPTVLAANTYDVMRESVAIKAMDKAVTSRGIDNNDKSCPLSSNTALNPPEASVDICAYTSNDPVKEQEIANPSTGITEDDTGTEQADSITVNLTESPETDISEEAIYPKASAGTTGIVVVNRIGNLCEEVSDDILAAGSSPAGAAATTTYVIQESDGVNIGNGNSVLSCRGIHNTDNPGLLSSDTAFSLPLTVVGIRPSESTATVEEQELANTQEEASEDDLLGDADMEVPDMSNAEEARLLSSPPYLGDLQPTVSQVQNLLTEQVHGTSVMKDGNESGGQTITESTSGICEIESQHSKLQAEVQSTVINTLEEDNTEQVVPSIDMSSEVSVYTEIPKEVTEPMEMCLETMSNVTSSNGKGSTETICSVSATEATVIETQSEVTVSRDYTSNSIVAVDTCSTIIKIPSNISVPIEMASDIPDIIETPGDIPVAMECISDATVSTKQLSDVPVSIKMSRSVSTSKEISSDVAVSTDSSSDVTASITLASNAPAIQEAPISSTTLVETASDVTKVIETISNDIMLSNEIHNDVTVITEIASSVAGSIETPSNINNIETAASMEMPEAVTFCMENSSDVTVFIETPTNVTVSKEIPSDVFSAKASSDCTVSAETSNDVTSPMEITNDVTVSTRETLNDLTVSIEAPSDVTVCREIPSNISVSTEIPSDAMISMKTNSDVTVSAETPIDVSVSMGAPTYVTVSSETPKNPILSSETPSDVTVFMEAPNDVTVTTETPNDAPVSTETSSDVTIFTETPSDDTISTETPSDVIFSMETLSNATVSAEMSSDVIEAIEVPSDVTVFMAVPNNITDLTRTTSDCTVSIMPTVSTEMHSGVETASDVAASMAALSDFTISAETTNDVTVSTSTPGYVASSMEILSDVTICNAVTPTYVTAGTEAHSDVTSSMETRTDMTISTGCEVDVTEELKETSEVMLTVTSSNDTTGSNHCLDSNPDIMTNPSTMGISEDTDLESNSCL